MKSRTASDMFMKILLVIIGISMAGLVSEIFLRIFTDYDNFFGWYGYPEDLYVMDKELGYRHRPNFRGFFIDGKYKDIPININSSGMRDKEIARDKASGRYRIIFLGDSITFGSGVREEETYIRLLEKKLHEKGFADTELVNAAHAGYQVNQYSAYMEELAGFGPDLFVIGLCMNDIIPAKIEDMTTEEGKKPFKKIDKTWFWHLKDFLKTHSALCVFINHKIKILLVRAGKTSSIRETLWTRIMDLYKNDPLEDFSYYVRKMQGFVKDKDIGLLVVIYPYLAQFSENGSLPLPQRRLREILDDAHIRYIDLFEPLRDTGDPDRYYLGNDPWHFNSQGHEFLSEKLYSAIKTIATEK